MKTRPTICAYYFPNWHVDSRNEIVHGKGWTEWRVAQYATPRFPGHVQPKVPLWGYEDESDPVVMSKKIKTASDYGVDAFIFDWYYDQNGLFRERCINEGFMKAENRNYIQFALMWANHPRTLAHPGTYLQPVTLTPGGETTPEVFKECTDYCIKNYFHLPNYLRVNDGIYFSLFRPRAMVEQLGGPQKARELFDDFRYRVEKAGLGKLTLDGRAPEISWDDFDFANRLIKEVGLDTTSNYGWGYKDAEDFPALDYKVWIERNVNEPYRISRGLRIPFNPVVMTGWDTSPRTVQSDMYDKCEYPFGTVIINNTPELFEAALRSTAEFMASDDATGNMIHIGCWNEWTEGSYLEPDTQYEYGFLEAVRNVFGLNKI